MRQPIEEGMSRPCRFYVQASMETEEAKDIESSGDSLAELIDNAMVVELTPDGVTLCTRGLYDYDDHIVRRGEEILAEAFMKGGNK